MGRHRAVAEKLIKRYPNSDFDELGTLDGTGADSLYLIMRFYQRLSLAVKYHRVHEVLICEMLAENFYYWYYACFKDHFVNLTWAVSPHIEALGAWFHEVTNLERHEKLRNKYELRLAEWKRSIPPLNSDSDVSI